MQLRFRPGLVQVPGVGQRAHHVVAAMHDHPGDVGDAVRVAQQLVLDLEEAAVDEVVVLDAGEGQRELRVFVAVDEVVVHVQEAGGAFPHAPCPGRGQPGGFVIAGQATVEGGDQVVPLHRRDRVDVVVPGVGEQAAGAFLVEPFQLPAAQHEDAAQDQLGHALRMGLRIGQRQGRTPAAAEHLPAVDRKVPAQRLDVGHQVPGGVVHQVGVRRGTAGATLVEQDDPVLRRIVELAHLRRAATAGPAMQHHHRLAVGVAALFVVQRVALVDLERTGVVGRDGGVKRAHALAHWLEERPIVERRARARVAAGMARYAAQTRLRPSRLAR